MSAGVLASFLIAATTMAAAAAGIPAGPAGDAFYTPPRTLPSTREGSVIWARPFSGGAALPSAASNYRVLYETISATGTFVAVSGTLAIPRGTPPARGWPLISWAHGTVGNAPECAPSRGSQPNNEQRMLDSFVRRGYVVAQTDYQGNGTPGIHPYLVAVAAARDVTDAAIASRELAPQIGRDWIVMGHSEGGAAALSTAALGEQIAPSLNLLGAVAYAPVAFHDRILTNELHNGVPNAGLVVVGLLIEGFATVDPRVVPSQILEPDFAPHLAELQQRCVTELMENSKWRRVVPRTVFRLQGQSGIDALYNDLVQNDPVNFAIALPTLIVNGVSDTMVSSEASILLADRLRRNGAPVTFKAYVGATHGSVLKDAEADVAAWVANRFAQAAAGR